MHLYRVHGEEKFLYPSQKAKLGINDTQIVQTIDKSKVKRLKRLF
jgi:hypothetical protein